MTYLMSGQLSELDRLQLQSRVWEPAGERLLAQIGSGAGVRAVDIGCGVLGWLRVLSRWVGADGKVVGTDFAQSMLDKAADFVRAEQLTNVELVLDDLFDSGLEPASFDLVHARFQLAPLGRMQEQLDAYLRLLRPGGVLVLEDPDSGSWRYAPDAPHTGFLIEQIRYAFEAVGGDFDAGRLGFSLLRSSGYTPHLRAEVVALEPDHPYLALPLQFASSLRPRLLDLMDEAELDELLAAAASELSQPGLHGLTFTLVQTWARKPSV